VTGGLAGLVPASALPRRVLCVAARAGDEVGACGGVLAMHAERGDALRVVVAAGDDAGLAESRAACAALAVGDLRGLGLAAGGLGAAHELVGRLRRELAEFGPALVYVPSSPEDLDHRACLRAALAAAASLGREGAPERPEVLACGAEAGEARVDVTPWLGRKRAALACLASRPAPIEPRAVEVFTPGRLAPGGGEPAGADPGAATAVITNFNKREELRENLDALRAQTRPFAEVVVVDNASDDGSAAMVRERYPEVRLVVMPHQRFGACETFNVGFRAARTPLIAILDDDVVLPPEWLERTVARLAAEPATTAIVSTEVVEPGMPEAFLSSPEVARERYMSTFRGCASLARAGALEAAGGYDERLFIYGNERDLTCRLLNLGYRVLHYPAVRAFHKTPYGIKPGPRSLYYHARNAWLTMLKYAPLSDLARLPWLVLTRVLLRRASDESSGRVTDAVGTIGIGRSLRETPGAWWILVRAAASVAWNVPYCLRRRRPVRAPDFELPLG
jgi:GT2 family glycosyltransferase/LmbE family N-acetylglucosaminyl deacetylase